MEKMGNRPFFPTMPRGTKEADLCQPPDSRRSLPLDETPEKEELSLEPWKNCLWNHLSAPEPRYLDSDFPKHGNEYGPETLRGLEFPPGD